MLLSIPDINTKRGGLVHCTTVRYRVTRATGEDAVVNNCGYPPTAVLIGGKRYTVFWPKRFLEDGARFDRLTGFDYPVEEPSFGAGSVKVSASYYS